MGFKREGIVALSPDRELLVYWCAGCEGVHRVNVKADMRPAWDWNGDVNKPTLSPSIREFWPARDAEKYPDGSEYPAKPESTRCHHFLREGVIEYLDDSAAHQLRGHHVLQPIPDNYGGVDV